MVVFSSSALPGGVSRTAGFHPPLQPDLFGPTPVAPDEVAVQLQTACRCGDVVAVVGAGAGPHAASLRCQSCGRHCAWLARAHVAFINRVIERRGIPREPIALPTILKPGPNDTGHNVVRQYDMED